MTSPVTGPGWARSEPRRRPRRRPKPPQQNVGRTERIASLIAGTLIGTFALRRRGQLGFVLSLAAGELVYRGMTGHCHVYRVIGIRRLT